MSETAEGCSCTTVRKESRDWGRSFAIAGMHHGPRCPLSLNTITEQELYDMTQQAEALAAALEKHGQHRRTCLRWLKGTAHTVEADCNCGIWAALGAFRGSA